MTDFFFCYESCNILFIVYRHGDNGFFGYFPKISDTFKRFAKIFQFFFPRSHERYVTLYKHLRRCMKISEVCQTLSRKSQSSFHAPPTKRNRGKKRKTYISKIIKMISAQHSSNNGKN